MNHLFQKFESLDVELYTSQLVDVLHCCSETINQAVYKKKPLEGSAQGLNILWKLSSTSSVSDIRRKASQILSDCLKKYIALLYIPLSKLVSRSYAREYRSVYVNLCVENFESTQNLREILRLLTETIQTFPQTYGAISQRNILSEMEEKHKVSEIIMATIISSSSEEAVQYIRSFSVLISILRKQKTK